MDNDAPEPKEYKQNFRLRKADSEEIFGPIDGRTLKDWAEGAQVAPADEIDREDDTWLSVTELEFLEMVYKVKFLDGSEYGPTTVGTLREFLSEGLVNDDTKVRHVHKNTSMPLGAVLAAIDFKPRDRREPDAPPSTDESLDDIASLPAVEMAKDQHIRQLEEDLRILKKKYDELLHKYRKLGQELVEARSGKR